MTICDDLRQSVLQAAIQGKLTKQFPEDGTAADLLASIKVEKEKLIKEKKIKKEKPLAPISEDEIPFDIPDNWEWVKLASIVNFKIGKTPPRSEGIWWKDDIPWVSIADMPENGVLISTKEKISQQALDEKFSGKISPAGSLIMSFKLTVGRVSILGINAVHNEAIVSIFPYVNPNNALRDYLFKLLPFISQYGDSKNAIKGKTLNNDSISNLLIALPPLAEQQRIVARVDELMAKIDELETVEKELVALKKAFPGDMKASLLQAAMQGKLTQQLPEDGSAADLLASIKAEKEQIIKEKKIKKEKPLAPISVDEIPFDIPDNWEWVHLEDIGRFGAGKTPDSDLISFYGKYPYFKVSDMNVAGNEKEMCVVKNWLGPEYSGTLFPKGSFIYPKNGGAVFTNKKRILVQDSLVDLNTGVYIPSNSVNQDFLFYLFSTLDFRHLYKGTALPTIDMDKVRLLIFPLPPLSEQQRIVEKLDKLMPLCDVLKEGDMSSYNKGA